MPTKPFPKLLEEINNGGLSHDISHAIQDLVGDIENIGAGGAITIKLSFTPKTYGEGQKVIEVHSDFTVKKPKRVRRPSAFFTTPENNLVKDDPRQANMFGELKNLPSGEFINEDGEVIGKYNKQPETATR